ncbi:1,6-anhydro-N-acetylmuramyl-L-alanine amidase AmpD [Noviherbaspirillum pedocola]|uniref:1,6-anhydro-N-acetylmuramyl-L-alanine amidase AmpD n=1 Tax=Noviherbaspirillum pedocola TaxID=2801341 RepID=A0A934SQ70_9BURK|nr:1,6-anhydro-N-acetylmuramyl-L-alanine amidase AmpD [Noviherbaspirillum pedocola]MBK4733492.1 1,6-anhydro-N-acetylmuramyl-L-alanine amidase AmpD [Noviherbaspirillum pedocola]
MNPIETMAALLAPDDSGWCGDVRRLASPNCDARPQGMEIDLLVIHNISLPPGQFGGDEIAALFTNSLDHAAHPYFEGLRGLRVSAHFLIRRDGATLQFVPAGMRAWHAGLSRFGERERCNDFSIGIELEGTDEETFTAVQYARLAALTEALARRYPLRHVAGHQHIAPERKTDPGPYFDWPAYQAACRQLPAAAALQFPTAV